MNTKGQHVLPSLGGGWSVRRTGAARAARVFRTQADAVRYAREQASKERTELYVHREDGTIAEARSYGTDPRRRKR